MGNLFSLEGKRLLVTGAGSGIGRATVVMASELGVFVILCDVNAESLDQTQKLCCNATATLCVDLTDVTSLKEQTLKVVQEHGKLNGVAHVAGIPSIVPLKVVTREIYDKVAHVNAYAGLQLAQLFADRRIGDVATSGSIVFVSSCYANVGSAANVCYAMSKGGVQSMTRALAIELAAKRIRVNCVAPGFVRSEMMSKTGTMFDSSHEEELNRLMPLGIGMPDDVAGMIVFLLSDAAKWCTGGIYPVDGGFTAQ